jgi:hypothetical protein
MAYQDSANLAGPDVVIGQVLTFAAANGWTIERNNLVGGNRTATIRKAGVTDYIHLYNTDALHVRMRISIGYDSGALPSAQPDVSGENLTLLGTGPYPTTFFFASQDQVWITVAIAASGEYRHFTFGRLDKAGAYTGGTYVDSTYWDTIAYARNFSFKQVPFQAQHYGLYNNYGRLRADIPDDARTNWFHQMGAPGDQASIVYGEAGDGEIGNAGTAAILVNRADKNAFSGRSVFQVIPLYVKRIGSQVYWSLLGTVQDVRYCSINKLEPEQEITIGSDVWKVFPVAGKRSLVNSSAGGPAGSGDYGYAIKKVT